MPMTDTITYWGVPGAWIRWRRAPGERYQRYVIGTDVCHTNTLSRDFIAVPDPKWPLEQPAVAVAHYELPKLARIRLYGVWWDGHRLRYSWREVGDSRYYNIDLERVNIIC